MLRATLGSQISDVVSALEDFKCRETPRLKRWALGLHSHGATYSGQASVFMPVIPTPQETEVKLNV